MKIAFAAAIAAMSPLVRAAAPLFATEGAALQACSGDEVVWVNLDHGRFYHKTRSSQFPSTNVNSLKLLTESFFLRLRSLADSGSL
jgi:hypothetical protein